MPDIKDGAANAQDSIERDFLSIEMQDGRKCIKYWGDCGERCPDDDNDPCDYAYIDADTDYCPLDEVLETGVSKWSDSELGNGSGSFGPCTENEAREIADKYFNGSQGKQLMLENISIDTPCGDYWCAVISKSS